MDESVMRVLELLQEGKITPQEAEQLIAALRGASTTQESPKEAQTSKSEQKSEKESEEKREATPNPLTGLNDLGERISKAIGKVQVEKIVERLQEQIRTATRAGSRWSATVGSRIRVWTQMGERPTNPGGLPERAETQHQEFYLAPGASIAVENPLGDVRIVGVEEGPATVKVKRVVWAPSETELQSVWERVAISLSGTDPRLELHISAPDGFEQGTVDVEITTPRALSNTHIKTHFGNVEVAHVAGTVEASTVSGSLHLHDIEGNVRGETTSGTIRIENIQGAATLATKSGDIEASKVAHGLNANTASGDVRASDIDGERVECKSVSGDVRLECVGQQAPCELVGESISGDVYLTKIAGNLALKAVSGDLFAADCRTDRAQAQSVSGDITLQFSSAFSGALQASTVSGDVDIALPAGSSVRVTLGTASGALRCDHDAQDVTATETLWSGRIGDGVGTLNVQTISGDVRVTRTSSEN